MTIFGAQYHKTNCYKIGYVYPLKKLVIGLVERVCNCKISLEVWPNDLEPDYEKKAYTCHHSFSYSQEQ
jgi:hypothetical protein